MSSERGTMHTISPDLLNHHHHHHHHHHNNKDIHSPIPSIKTPSPIPSPRKHMVKSTSIIITSTSNECSPVHSLNEANHNILNDNLTHNTSSFQSNNIMFVNDNIQSNNKVEEFDNSNSNCKTISQNKNNPNRRFFRRDKVTPLKVEDPGPTIQTLTSSITAITSKDSPHSPNNQPPTKFGGETFTDSIINTNSNHDDFVHNLTSHSNHHDLTTRNDEFSNLNSNSNSKQTNSSKFTRLPPLRRQESADTSGHPTFSSNHQFKNATQITAFNKSDIFTLSGGSSDLGAVDFSYLSVPRNGSWKNLDDSVTLATSPGQMSSSTMSVTRSLGSKIKLSTSDKSSFIFQPEPLGSFKRRQRDSPEFSSPTCKITNLSTSQGRQWNAAMILGLSVAPIIALLIQNCINLYHHNNVFNGQEGIKSDILYSVEIGNVMHYTQIERGTSVLFVSTFGQDKKVNDKLLEAYNNTDRAISQLSKWLSEKDPPHFRTEKAYWSRIKRFRRNLWNGTITKVETVLEFYSNDNAVIERWIGKSVQLSTNGDLWRTLIGYYMLIISKEQAGVERALGGSFYANGGFSNKRMQEYLQRKVTGLNFFSKAGEYVGEVQRVMDIEFKGTTLDEDLADMRAEILLNRIGDPDAEMATHWFENMTEFIDMMKTLQDHLANDIVSELNSEIEDLRSKVVEAIVIITISLLLFPFVVITVYRLTKRIQAYAEMLHERSVDLEMERKRSEMLLYELLPEPVARKLLNSEEVVPMTFKAVTIFFSDIVGFTSICSRSTPMQVIDMLNTLYRIFDDIISSYKVYKVETIGDAYMVASGVPDQTREHAPEIAGAALDMRDSMDHLMVNHLPDEKLQLRIGINSGPVVAGVVGHKMPRYCLFGDTVNVASRMESTSLPLQIQISESTRLELERWGTFDISPRGNVEIKGKGLMQTHWLTGRDSTGLDVKPYLRHRYQTGDIMFVDDVKM